MGAKEARIDAIANMDYPATLNMVEAHTPTLLAMIEYFKISPFTTDIRMHMLPIQLMSAISMSVMMQTPTEREGVFKILVLVGH